MSSDVLIDQKQRMQVQQAIEKAEKQSSVEIYAVLARRSDNYIYVAMFFAALSIFTTSLVLVLLLDWPFGATIRQWLNVNEWGSDNIQAAQINLWLFCLAQLIAFIMFYIAFKGFPALSQKLTPKSISHARSHANAVQQFYAHGISETSSRRAVLVFVSLEERFAEILVDKAIEEKCGRDEFLQIIPGLIEHCSKGDIISGYVEAINDITKVLEKPFPPKKKKQNVLDDKLVVL